MAESDDKVEYYRAMAGWRAEAERDVHMQHAASSRTRTKKGRNEQWQLDMVGIWGGKTTRRIR